MGRLEGLSDGQFRLARKSSWRSTRACHDIAVANATFLCTGGEDAIVE